MTAFPHPRLILLAAALLLATHAHADHVKVFLLGGQSNMVGNNCLTSELPAALQDPQADVLFYPGSLITLRPGYGGQFGPEITFGRTIADASPSETYCLIKHAANGSSLLGNWNPATGNSYASFRTRVANGIAALTAAGHTYEIEGMLWTQGEAEAAAGTTTPVYEAALNEFIADIRTRYGPNLPFFVSRLSNSQTSINATGLSTIRAAQEYVALNDPYTYLVDTDGMSVGTDNLHFNEPGQMALGQAFGQSYIGSVVPDETAPEIALLSPANGFAEHPATNNLVINFNEPVVLGTGFITVRRADGTLIESFDVANPPANLSANLSGATLTIDLSANLAYSTGYYVEIDPTAIADNSGNSFAGFSGPTMWGFTTAAGQVGGLIGGSGISVSVSSLNGDGSNYPPQTVVDGTGLNGSGEHAAGGKSEWVSSIGADIANGFISFDLGGTYVLDLMHVWNCTQYNSYGIKQLDIYVSDVFSPGDPEGAGAANWKKIADNVSFAAAGTPNVGFDLETQTGISLPTTAVRHVRFEIDTNQAGSTSGYVGLAEVQFFAAGSGPDTTDPIVSSLSPVNGASGVPTTANLEVTFSEPLAFGTGFITIWESIGGAVFETYDVGSLPTNLTLSGSTLTINPTADLAASTGYYVEIDPTAIDDLSGNSFAGISGSTTWNLTTAVPDNTQPTISSLDPVNGTSDVPTAANLEVTFSEPVAFGTGSIIVRKTAGGAVFETYDVGSLPSNLSFDGATLTINPTADFAASTGYYVEIDATAIDDLAGNSFAGFSGSATWSFITAAGQTGGLIDGSGITVTVSSINGTGTVFPPQSVVDGTGLNGSGEHGEKGSSEWYTNNGQSPLDSWISFDLGASVVLDSVHVWNATQYVDYGIAQLDIYVSTLVSPGDPEGAGAGDWTKIATDVFFAAAGSPNVGFDLENQTGISLPTTAVRHVRFESDTQIGGGSNYLGLAEVQFFAAAISSGNNFADWISDYPGVGGLTGFNDDSDHDGNDNGLENFFGTDPSVFSVGLVSVGLSGNTFTFTHPLNASPADDISAAYLWSKDLATFYADGATVESTKVDFVQGSPSGGMVSVTATITGASIDKLFVKVGVTKD